MGIKRWNKRNILWKRRRRRRIITVLLSILAVLLLLDIVFETAGLPEFAKKFFFSHINREGKSLTAEKVQIGLFGGIRVTGLRFSSAREGFFSGSAWCRIATDWRVLLPGTGLPLSITVNQGFFRLKLQQALQGKENLPDLYAEDLYLDLVTKDRIRQIKRFSAKVNGNILTFTGTADQILHIIIAEFFESLKNSIAGRHPKRKKASPLVLDPDFQRILRELLLKNQEFHKNSNAPLLCRGKIHADMESFDRCRGEFDLFVPSFTAGGTRFNSIHEHAVLKDGNLYLGKMDILFARDSSLVLAGEFNGEASAFSGTVTGKCRAEDLHHLLGDASSILKNNRVVLGKGFAEIEGNASRFEPAAGTLKGDLTIRLPELTFRDMSLKDILLLIHAEQNIIHGELRHASPGSGGFVSGTFTATKDELNFALEGNAKAQEILKLFEKDTANRILQEISFDKNSKNVFFKGQFNCTASGKLRSGTLSAAAEGIAVRGIVSNRIAAKAEFSEGSFCVKDLAVTFRDGTFLSGEVSYQKKSSDFSAEVICRGSPDKFIKSLYSPLKERMLELTKDVKWPEKANSTEIMFDMHANFSHTPFMRLSGTLVMKDFAFRKIPFQFGTVHFILDESNTLLLPAARLRSDKGELALQAAWPGSIPVANTNFPKPSDSFDFSLVSSLPGDQLITIFYPEWDDPDSIIAFPFPVVMSAEGSINYKDPSKIRIRGNITNADCLWNGIRIEDMDFNMECVGTRLALVGGKGDICGGRVHADYSYDVVKEQGYINLDFSRVDLSNLLTSLNISNILAKNNGNGEISGHAGIDFRYNEKDDLLLYGNMSADISGEELWGFPVIGAFLKQAHNAWPVVNTGSVKKIHTEGTFLKDVFKLDRLSSDGNVIAINATGEYCWITTDYHVRFQAELLKGALPFNLASHILTPVTWIMTKEYKGKYSDFMGKKPDTQEKKDQLNGKL